MLLGLINMPIVTGLFVANDSNYEALIDDTIKWADSKVLDCQHDYKKKVACIRLICKTRLERHLLAKKDDGVVMISNEIISYNIDSLGLSEDHLDELRSQEYIVVKVYD